MERAGRPASSRVKTPAMREVVTHDDEAATSTSPPPAIAAAPEPAIAAAAAPAGRPLQRRPGSRRSGGRRAPAIAATRRPGSRRFATTARQPSLRDDSKDPFNYHGEPSEEGRAGRERVEGVSHSLPDSDLLALTSSHMFLSVMI
jgi:hypothetical protein